MATATATPGSATIQNAPAHIKKSLSGAIGDAANSVFNVTGNFARQAGTWDRNTAAYAKTFIPALDDLGRGFGGISRGIAGVETSINTFYANALNTVRKETNGFSDHLGATFTDLSSIVRNPLDFQNISNCAASILERHWPGSSGSLNKSIQNLHLDKLAKAPGLLFSGLQRLARAIDNLLSIPIAFASQIYFGIIGIIKQIGNTLNRIIQGFQQFIFNFLDELIPLTEIIQLLNDIGTLAGQIQGIAGIFGGANIVSGFALQINTFTTQINSVLANPLDAVIGALPTSISQGFSQIMYTLQNPQSLINQFLPPELSQIFSKLTQITGYGFNGNMGYGFASILQGQQGGVINGILSQFASQYSIVAPLLAGGGMAYQPPISYRPSTNNGYIQGKRYAWNPNTKLYEVIQ